MVIFFMENSGGDGKELEDMKGINYGGNDVMLIKNGLIWIHKHMRN